MSTLLKLFCKTETAGTLPNSVYEATVTIIAKTLQRPKPKGKRKKEKVYNIPYELVNTCKLYSRAHQEITHQDKVAFVPGMQDWFIISTSAKSCSTQIDSRINST